ncbi:LptF/LptG family permease [Thermocrinis minervae]|uniref:Predicted permease YjgP/YjgQ family protein n=1 Tax=Thermocrinis minervae TaxID=381751 RepID=A0A1M6QWR9_9AQUI|nr:LptF/LptG family permease [Thermocrinis minervae]SHK24681.1 Predicted permease YjgP/YjgQ family protein [Thermocrinis minervae]
MLWIYLSRKVLRLAFLLSFIFSLAILVIQFFRIGEFIFSFSLESSLLYLTAFLLNLFAYFFPTSLLVSIGFTFFELKEHRKLEVIQSFGVSPFKLISRLFILLLPFLFLMGVCGHVLTDQHVSFLRKYLMLKNYVNFIFSVPIRTFSSFSDATVYIKDKEGQVLKDVMFKLKDRVVYAHRATIEQNTVSFQEGSLLLLEDNKFYSVKFGRYTLELNSLLEVSFDKKKLKRDKLLNLINYTITLVLMPVFLFLIHTRVRHISQFYYLTTIALLIYHGLLLLIRQAA